jgi:hypothetical protein
MEIPKTDVNTEEGSSDSSDVNGQGSSTEQQDVNKTDLKQAEEQQEEKGADEEAKSEDAEGSSAEGTGEEKTDDQQDSQQKVENAVFDKPEDEKLPFGKHPRFQELITEKNQARQQVEQLRPAAQANQALTSFMQQNGIQGQELQRALEYLRLRRIDPAAAFRVIKQDYDSLAMFAGERLPEDIQAEVAAGTLSPERAKEIAQARAQQQHSQFLQGSQQQQQQAQHEELIQGAVNVWAQNRLSLDPDFKPKAPGQRDGKWELVDMKLKAMRLSNPPRTPQDVLLMTEQAYKEANEFFASFAQRTGTRQRPSSQQTNTRTHSVIKTPADVIKAIMAGTKPNQVKYE